MNFLDYMNQYAICSLSQKHFSNVLGRRISNSSVALLSQGEMFWELDSALTGSELHSCIWNEVHRTTDLLIHLYSSAAITMAKGKAAAAVENHYYLLVVVKLQHVYTKNKMNPDNYLW